MIRILIVDDQRVIREKLRYMVKQSSDMEVVGIATDGSSALEQVELLRPDVILIDIEMPNLDGIAATKVITDKFPETKVLVLSSFDSQEYVGKSMAAGAKGYVLKSLSAEELHNSIKFIHQGYSQILGPGLSKEIAVVGSKQVDGNSLTSKSKAAIDNTVSYNGIDTIGYDSPEQAIVSKDSNKLERQSKPKSEFHWKRWASGWALLNIAVWTIALLGLKFKAPTYVSEWSLVLPGEEKVDFKIPNVGEALARNNSAVDDIDPRNNILYLASSNSVLLKAADSMEMSSSEFGKPDIELVDGSAIISFKILGDSPEQAQEKARALHRSILQTIKSFRVDKNKQRNENAGETVEADRARLAKLQDELSQYTSNSDLVSPEQIQVLIGRIESLRDQKRSIRRDLDGFDRQIASLSGNLGMTAEEAENLLALQGDSVFQQYLQQYNQTTGSMAVLESRFTTNAPQVIEERRKQQDIERVLLERGQWLIDKPVDRQTLKKLTLKDSSGQKDFDSAVRSIVAAANSQQILAEKDRALEGQIRKLDARIKKLNQEKIPFENLQREIQFAEALLTSKSAKLDVAADSSPAFPDIQMLSSPSLPDKRNPNDVRNPLVGALALTFLSTTGLMLFAWDKKNAFKF